jgi:MarR family transcriptional regulator for hemolysin
VVLRLFISDHHYFFHQYLQTARLFTKRLNDQLARYDLYHSQWAIIYYLNDHGPSTLVDITNYLNVEKPTITRTVTRLQERKLIEQISSNNKREKRIQLTSAGMEIYTVCINVVSEFEENVMSSISEDEIKMTMQILGKMQKQLQHE